MHEPRFSSSTTTRWFTTSGNDLAAAGADVLLSGHMHNYERFAPQTSDGTASASGVRQFVVGTGGKSLVGFSSILPNSEVRNSSTYGVLKLQLTLHANSYDWAFVPIAGQTFTDAGTAACH